MIKPEPKYYPNKFGYANRKLSQEQVAEIRKEFKWNDNAKELAHRYNVSLGTIYRVANGAFYKDETH